MFGFKKKPYFEAAVLKNRRSKILRTDFTGSFRTNHQEI
jgi:hypothetical protein